jgi:hypothetical protein
MRLREQYRQRGRRNHPVGTPEGERKNAAARVGVFLDYVECHGVRYLQQIEQRHFAAFLDELRKRGKADRTIYRYKIAIRSLAKRHGLGIVVRTATRTLCERRREQVLRIIGKYPGLAEQHRAGLIAELERVI